jgi:hypothetical protein
MLKYGNVVPTIYGNVPDSYIIGLLKNAEWTDEEVANITEDQLEQVVKAINDNVQQKLENRIDEFEEFCKQNQETYEKLQTLNLQVAQYYKNILNQLEYIEEWELEKVYQQIQEVDAMRWKIIRETMGDKAFIEMMTMEI